MPFTKKQITGFRRIRKRNYRARRSYTKKYMYKRALTCHVFRTKTISWYCRSIASPYDFPDLNITSLPLYHVNNTAPVAPSTRGGYGLSMAFAVDALPNISDLRLLYDQYKIRKIKVRFEPSYNVTEALLSEGISGQQYLRIAHDYDDSVIPTSEDDVLQYGNTKSYDIRKPFTIIVYPWISSNINNSSSSAVTAVSQRARRMDITHNIYHYGLKMWVPWVGAFSSDRVIGNFTIEYEYMCYNNR